MKNLFTNLFLSKEVRDALENSRQNITNAFEAKTIIDSIYVTEQLAEMFWKQEDDVATTLKEDFYTELLIGKMLAEKEEREAEEVKVEVTV